jgi:hypothetical protein
VSVHQIKYSYLDVPTIERFSESNAFIRGLMGPFGSGKSSGCVTELVNRAQQQKLGPGDKRRTRFACIRNTYPELRGTTIKTLFQWLPPTHFGTYVENKHTYTIKAFDRCEIEIVFLALDKPDDLKQLLSLELTGAWLNEAREIPWAVWEVLQGRVGRYPAMIDGGPTWTGIWADTNPPDTDSKWYKFFEEKNWVSDFRKLQREGHLPMSMQEKDYSDIFKQPGGLAPNAENISNLPGGKLYYARISAGKDPEWVKVYVDGDYGFVIDGKAVYQHQYKDAVHCKSIEPIEGLPIYRGWDFGLTPACVLSQELPDGRWLVFDELVSEGMGIDRFSDEVLEHCGRSFRGGRVSFIDDGDPAGQQRVQTDEKTCFQILQAKGVNIEASEVSITKRLESVRLPMGRMHPDGSMFVLHPRCKKLRKGFMGGYRYRRMQVSGERYTDAPDKNEYSHPHDALQYTACRLFGGMLVAPRFQDDDTPFGRSGDVDVSGRGASEFTGY